MIAFDVFAVSPRYISAPYSEFFLNPAVTIALAFVGNLNGRWCTYILAQLLAHLRGHICLASLSATFFGTDAMKMALFCTSPAIRHPLIICSQKL